MHMRVWQTCFLHRQPPEPTVILCWKKDRHPHMDTSCTNPILCNVPLVSRWLRTATSSSPRGSWWPCSPRPTTAESLTTLGPWCRWTKPSCVPSRYLRWAAVGNSCVWGNLQGWVCGVECWGVVRVSISVLERIESLIFALMMCAVIWLMFYPKSFLDSVECVLFECEGKHKVNGEAVLSCS